MADGLNGALGSINNTMNEWFFKTTLNPNVQQVRGQNIIANEIAEETIHPGGAEAYAMTKGLVSALPGVGMIMDLEALTDTNNSVSTRAMAGLSIALVFSVPIDDLGKTAKNAGQKHHPITTKIIRELSKNSNISQDLLRNYRKFTTRARDLPSHNGYDAVYRKLDADMLDWFGKHRDATEKQFINKLKRQYAAPEISARFPTFLTDLNNWLRSLGK